MYNSYRSLILLENPMFIFVHMLVENIVKRARVKATKQLLELCLISTSRTARYSSIRSRADTDSEEADGQDGKEAVSERRHLARSLFGSLLRSFLVVGSVYELSLDISEFAISFCRHGEVIQKGWVSRF